MLVLFENGVIENDYCRCMLMLEHQHTLKSFMYDVHITWYGSVLWEVGGQSSALILWPWQVQLTGVRGGGPSSLPPLHAAQPEKGRSVNECSPESHHLLPPPDEPLTLADRDVRRAWSRHLRP